MIDNIWFYTLSTSAQVLSALAGLFAVFVVWKIQDIEKYTLEIRDAIYKIIPYLSGNISNYEVKRLDDLFVMGDDELLSIFSEMLDIKNKEPERVGIPSYVVSGNSAISYSLDNRTEYLYKNSIDKKYSILKSLKNVLILNFTVISACILYLTFSSLINEKFLILIIVSLGVLACLYVISRSIYKITIK